VSDDDTPKATTPQAIAAAAERHGLLASDLLDLARSHDGVITNADEYAQAVAETYPSLKRGRPQAAPEQAPAPPTAEQLKHAEGVAVGRIIDASRTQVGREPLFSEHYGGDAA
jgi:hypothetical protein